MCVEPGQSTAVVCVYVHILSLHRAVRNGLSLVKNRCTQPLFELQVCGGRAGIFRGRFQPEPSIGFNTTDVLCSTYLFMLADENCKCFIFIWDYGMNVCLFAPEKYSHVLSYVHIWRLFFCRAYEWNTSIASTWQFRLWGLLCWHKFTYLLT